MTLPVTHINTITQNHTAIDISVIIPCYNEAESLTELDLRLHSVCGKLVQDKYEIIYIDDGSKDRTWVTITELAANKQQVLGLHLSRNFGQQEAILAGLTTARGKMILIMDADLQDPPELIPEMVAKMANGADVVFGQRISRSGESWFKKTTSHYFYRILNKFTPITIPYDAGDFRLISRRVVNSLLQMPESYLFFRGMVAWLGYKQVPVYFNREARHKGTTKFSLIKMVNFAVDAITGFSILPLRLCLLTGLLSILAVFVLFGYVIYSWLWLSVVPGWASTMTVMLFFGTLQLLFLGILGEYVGRTYIEGKKRPLYVIDDSVSTYVIDHNMSNAMTTRTASHN